MFHRLAKRIVCSRGLQSFLLLAGACGALQLYLLRTDTAETAAAFGSVLPVFLVCCSCALGLARRFCADTLPLMVCGLFSALGFALQASCDPAAARELKLFCLAAFAACLCAALGWFALGLVPQCLVYLGACVSSAAGFLLLRLCCKPVNGSYLGVFIGGRSFQLTGVLELVIVAGFCSCLSCPGWGEALRIKAALFLLGLAAAGYFLINELGCLLVVLLVFALLAVLCLSPKGMLALFAGALGIGGVGVAFLRLSVALGGKGPFRLGQLIWAKLMTRFRYFNVVDFTAFPAEELAGRAWQPYTAWRALLLAKPFGPAPYRLAIAVKQSDLCLAFLASKFGVSAIFLCLLGVFLLGCSTLLGSSRCKGWRSLLGVACGGCVCITAVVNLFSTVSLCLVGLPFPFIGSGGSSYVVSWVCITLLCLSTRGRRQPRAEKEQLEGGIAA